VERTKKDAWSSDSADQSWRGLYCVSGILFILTAAIWLVVSRSASTLYASGYPGDPESYLQLVSQHKFLATMTWSLWILADFLLMAPTVAMCIVLQRYGRTLALLGSLLAMFFNVYDVCVTELNSLTLVTLSHGYAGAATDALRASFVAAASYGYYALPLQTVLSFAIGSFAYLLWSVVMVKSIFPRWTAIYGAVVSVVGVLGSASPMFPASIILGLLQYLCVPLMALWFIFVGVQLYRYGRRLSGNVDFAEAGK
jgi:hypothetical protein